MQDDQDDDIAATALHAGDEASATPRPMSRAAGIVHVVTGSNGENRIRAEGATRGAANVQSVIVRTTAVVMPRPPVISCRASSRPRQNGGRRHRTVDAYAPDRLVTDRDGSGRRWPPQYGPAPGPGPAVSR